MVYNKNMSGTITCRINGNETEIEYSGRLMLLEVLRDTLHLTGTKNGCGTGHCGSCTVIVNGKAKRACITKVSSLESAEIETIENGEQDKMIQMLQQAFILEGAVQCGFCMPGMIMAAKALLLNTLHPSREEIKEALKHNYCRCTGYVSIVQAIERAAEALRGEGELSVPPLKAGRYVGQSVPRYDAPDKVRGLPIFADDYYENGMLYGKVKLSEYSHAEIAGIDTAEAEEIEGVRLILLGKDIPGKNAFGLERQDHPVIALSKVRYLGDIVAAVFADSKEAAEKGAEAVEVRYRPLKAVTTIEESASETVLLHEDGNLAAETLVYKGDMEKGFAESDVVVEGEYTVPAVEHAYLEPESCLAKYENGVLTVWTSSQSSRAMRTPIAENCALPEEKVRVIQTLTGGGFGGKEEPTIQVHAALGALRLGVPVKMTLSREESIRISTKRHAMKIRMKHGAGKDGKLLAFSSSVLCDAGAYSSLTKYVNFRASVAAAGPYEIPNVRAESKAYFTNTNPGGAFRGFGSTQVCFASEIQMDKLAAELGIDPIQFRKINGIRSGGETITGQVLYTGVGYIETLEAVEDTVKKWRSELKPARPGNKIGIGIASSYKNVGIGTGTKDGAGAIIEITPDGALEVRTGATEMGQGLSTVAAQIAAQESGVSYGLIRIVNCDTARCPDGGVTTASRATFVTGNAVRLCAEEMGRYLREAALKTGLLKRPGEEFIREDLIRIYSFLLESHKPVSAEYSYYPPKTFPLKVCGDHGGSAEAGQWDIHWAYCFTTHAVCIEADPETGDFEVLKVAAAQDAGKAIHPLNFRRQVEGAVVMGLGYGLTEAFIQMDDAIVTDNLKKLNVPMIGQVPEIEVHIVEIPHAEGPYGAKGMGEVPLNPVAPAISNALFNAIGVRFDNLPIKRQLK